MDGTGHEHFAKYEKKKLFIGFNSTSGLKVDLHVRQKWFGLAFLCDFRPEFWEEVTLLRLI